jgi:SpoVK/Ycf46/Vps4 family AAA+-type ATPase
MKRQKKADKSRSVPHLTQLAERLEATACWKDVTLPAPDCQRLQEIVKHLKNKAIIPESSSRLNKISRGSSVIALFAGPGGSVKNLAAAAIANDLNYTLYRVDLSLIVGKYIGETEKNLQRVFDAADKGNAILMFDEADSLFGKRSDVEDSHERYANSEVSYLLQRMESFQGLTILSSNTKESIDKAFIPSFNVVVEFPSANDSKSSK